jgi:hypothetical protein
MKTFLVDIILPEKLQEDINKMIPTQRKIVNTLINEGIILSYSLSNKRNRLFVVISQETEEDVMITVQRFPIFKLIVDFEIIELLSHETVSSEMPQVWLN